MKNTLKKITIQEVTKIFSSFNNYPSLFENLPFVKKKIPVNFLTLGKLDTKKKQVFKEENTFSNKFLIKSSGDKFIFNELITDNFTVLSASNSFFNINILESFSAYTFSRTLLCEKENKDLPALIISYVGDDEYWFIVK